ncbi:VanZ family protein [Agromyces larvae]|uniref:VanZ family protein n=1 Tax=Agromyces larvae TaxID=2929802 RepID=A0ABY4BYZ4_9MICO|nr:VanZ family protein [Agromyces larvae]UOE44344.1 VanZ family protein [Agromyces larvae]
MGERSRSRSSTIARALLVPYLVLLALIVFLPAREAGRVTGIVGWAAELLAGFGVPREPAAVALEFLANVALFVPFGVLLALAWPRLGAWSVIGIGAATATVIELVQLGIPSRVSTVSDVIANTTGTAIGLVLVLAVAAGAVHRHQRVVRSSRRRTIL